MTQPCWIISQGFLKNPVVRYRFEGFIPAWQELGFSLQVWAEQPAADASAPYPATENSQENFQTTPLAPVQLGGLSVPLFPVKMLWLGLMSKSPPQVIVGTGSALCLVVAFLLSFVHRAQFVADFSDSPPPFFAIHKFIARVAKALVVPTHTLKNSIQSFGVAVEKIQVIPSGVSQADFDKAQAPAQGSGAERVRGDLQLNNLVNVILFYGEFKKSYALGQVVDVARRLITRSDVLFLLVGDGEDEERLQRLAAGMPNIKFLPFTERHLRWDFFNAAQICLATGTNRLPEPPFISGYIFDIFAAGKPVVCSAVGDVAQLMEASDSALSVQSEAPEKMAKAILSLLDSPDRAKQMGQSGRVFVKGNYLQPALAQRYATLFKKGE